MLAAEETGSASTGAPGEEITVGTDRPAPGAPPMVAAGATSNPSIGSGSGRPDLEHRLDDLRLEVDGLRDELAQVTASLNALRASLGG